MVELLLEPIYDKTIIGSSAQTERKRIAWKAQQKKNRQNKRQSLREIKIMCSNKPRQLADQKTDALLYFRIGLQGHQFTNSKKPAHHGRHSIHCKTLENSSRGIHLNTET